MSVRFQYGLLCEGGNDIPALQTLIERVAMLYDADLYLNNNLSQPASGPISKPVIRVRTKLFIANSLDLGVYVADYDKAKPDRRSLIVKTLQDIDKTWYEKSIIGVPEPHFEEWLLADEDLIKGILNLDHTKPLPFIDRPPRDRLLSLVSSYGDVLTVGEVRLTIASKANLNTLVGKSPSFSKFTKSMCKVINNFNNP